MKAFHRCSGIMQDPQRRCWHSAALKVNGRWYCRQHLPKPPPTGPEISNQRLQELSQLAKDPGPDRRAYVRLCIEEFPKLVKELIRLRG